MILDVLIVPNPILKQKSARVVDFDSSLETLIHDMFDTMTEHHGVGLAAPQVGILQQVMVLWYNERKMALINPEIATMQGALITDEGCLSIPNVRFDVKRADRILVKAQNRKGKPITLREKGMTSRIIQHEHDHLHGILITDRRLS